MVLNELGSKINAALRSMSNSNEVDEKVLDDLIKELCAALLESDVNVKLVQTLRQNIKSQVKLSEVGSGVNKKKLIQKTVMDELSRLVDPGVEAYQPVKGKSNIIMFVGLQGSGKTTTCTKLAYHYQRKGWKTALVCADTFRAGAFDQLKQNATKAKIPYYGSYTEADPVQIALEGVNKFKQDKFEIIIVDTSGRHKQESELFEEMLQIFSAVKPNNVIFVMDGSIGQAADSQARAFKSVVDIGSVIITKMDGHAKGGGAISAVAATQSPIIFIGTGEHMHDLERFAPRPFISKMLGMGDLSGLMETVQDLKLEQSSGDLLKKLHKGEFSIRDMHNQFQNIMKLGPISKVMGMLPGMSPDMVKMMDGEGGTKHIKKMMTIFDSMTDEELDSEGRIFFEQPTRLKRVAQGAGHTQTDVLMILDQYKQFSGMIKQMGGSNGMLANLGMTPDAMKNGMNPLQMRRAQQNMKNMMQNNPMLRNMGMGGGLEGMMEQMSSMMGGGGGGLQDMMKNMMGSMGGAGGMQDMMKNMMGSMGGGGGGGMPDLSNLQNMMKSFGGMGSGTPPGSPSTSNAQRRR